MKKIVFNDRMSLVQKITLSGLFIALTTILQKVIAINYVGALPFLRVTFGGCSLIIYSSIVLGPFWGLLIGASSDLLGYLIFDPKTGGLLPQITFIYALLGFASYFIYKLIKLIKNKKALLITEYSVYVLLFIGATLFLELYPDIQLWERISFPIIIFALLIILIICNIFISKHFKKRNVENINVHTISFSCFVIELLIMIGFGSLMKGWAFGFSIYPIILICQILVAFVNIPLNTFLISYIMFFTRKYIE